MSDDHAAVAKGARARNELEVTTEAFAKVREAAIRELLNTSAGQEAKRERLIVTCQILDAVRSVVLGVANDGEIAAAALARQNLLRPN